MIPRRLAAYLAGLLVSAILLGLAVASAEATAGMIVGIGLALSVLW